MKIFIDVGNYNQNGRQLKRAEQKTPSWPPSPAALCYLLSGTGIRVEGRLKKVRFCVTQYFQSVRDLVNLLAEGFPVAWVILLRIANVRAQAMNLLAKFDQLGSMRLIMAFRARRALKIRIKLVQRFLCFLGVMHFCLYRFREFAQGRMYVFKPRPPLLLALQIQDTAKVV